MAGAGKYVEIFAIECLIEVKVPEMNDFLDLSLLTVYNFPCFMPHLTCILRYVLVGSGKCFAILFIKCSNRAKCARNELYDKNENYRYP